MDEQILKVALIVAIALGGPIIWAIAAAAWIWIKVKGEA